MLGLCFDRIRVGGNVQQVSRVGGRRLVKGLRLTHIPRGCDSSRAWGQDFASSINHLFSVRDYRWIVDVPRTDSGGLLPTQLCLELLAFTQLSPDAKSLIVSHSQTPAVTALRALPGVKNWVEAVEQRAMAQTSSTSAVANAEVPVTKRASYRVVFPSVSALSAMIRFPTL